MFPANVCLKIHLSSVQNPSLIPLNPGWFWLGFLYWTNIIPNVLDNMIPQLIINHHSSVIFTISPYSSIFPWLNSDLNCYNHQPRGVGPTQPLLILCCLGSSSSSDGIERYYLHESKRGPSHSTGGHQRPHHCVPGKWWWFFTSQGQNHMKWWIMMIYSIMDKDDLWKKMMDYDFIE